MPKTPRLRGARESAPETLRSHLVPSATVTDAVRTDALSRASAPVIELNASEDDLIEVELENGVRFVTTIRQLRDDADRGRTRSAEPGLLPTHYPQASPQRGLLGLAIRRIITLFVEPRVIAEWAANRVEAQLAGHGIHRITRDGQLVPSVIDSGTSPVLLFIHGTASSTRGAYGSLWTDTDAREYGEDLFKRYGEKRIFGFEHCTLTASPLENAIDLLTALPERCPPLHVVSHSRGGLVGDLIAHGGLAEAFTPELLKACRVRPQDRPRYAELNRLLAAKAPRVERFVRVACPAGGTTFASGRLDIFLSILSQVLRRVPLAGPLLEPIGELLAAVAKERANPDVLPGLEAQMPTSSLVRVLAGSKHVLDSDLTVIAGDSDGFLKNLANLFYWGANDLVVDTSSMYAGARRRQRRWWLAEGSKVDHCNYFSRGESNERLVAGLTRADDATGGFAIHAPRGRGRGPGALFGDDDGLGRGEVGAHRDRPAVFLLPGIMGSHLAQVNKANVNRIWIDIPEIILGGMRKLRAGAANVQAEALVGLAYAEFVAFLTKRGQHVLPFPYDWRLSVTEAATALAADIEARLDASDRPICIVAHSMGGLVARAFLAASGDLWERTVSRGGRLIQLGTPNRGSYVIPRILAGDDELVRKLVAADQTMEMEDWTKLVAAFPGLLEMAPHPGGPAAPDFFDKATWRAFSAMAEPAEALLKDTCKVIKESLADLDDVPRVEYVAGVAERTPTFEGVLTDPAVITWTPRGDGRVTWDSGIPAGVRTWYVHAEHGDLLNHRAAFHGLLDLVEGRPFPRLSKEEPVRRDGPVAVPVGQGALMDPEFDAQPIPDEETLARAALGMEPRRSRGRFDRRLDVPPCSVRVVLGDLAYTRNPVVVGHYVGDPLVSAEAALDRALDGALSFRHQLGLYAGDVGTAEAVLRRAKSEVFPGEDADAADRERPGPSGAVVVGLGRVGDLGAGGLTRSVVAGLLRLVQAKRDLGRSVSSLSVTSLLIGTGEAGITLSQSLEAILTAVQIANRELAKVPRSTSYDPDAGTTAPAITTIEFLELLEDRALLALRSVRAMRDLFDGAFHMPEALDRTAGRQRRVTFQEPDGWWTRLVIRRDDEEPERIHFLAPGDHAGSRSECIVLQPAILDGALSAAIASAHPTSPGLSRTLFEMLIPHRLKGSASDQRNLALVLDETTAGFPWELLIDRRAVDGRPLGVGAGLLRQLRLDESSLFRPTSPHKRIVVIGDPPSKALDLPELPGAQAEARAVADLFAEREWNVARRIRNDARTRAELDGGELNSLAILDALLTTDPRILHLAGHGVHVPGKPAESGMVLGGPAPDGRLALLTPALVEQISLVPEVVFLNCCHLGRVEPRPHRLAANLAAQFIRCGARVVVAAGWAVDDAAALTFAQTFYDAMLGGITFGDAVRAARHAVWSRHGDVNTWAAYQCYGDPGYRLTMDLGVRERIATGRTTEYLDPCELIAALENLGHRACVAHEDPTLRALAADLRGLAHEVERREWSERGDVAIALARAFGEFGEYADGVHWYNKAATCEYGWLSLRDLEQRANLRARQAASAWRTFCGSPDEDAATEAERLARRAEVLARRIADVDLAIADLERVVDLFGPTRGRHALIASARKRRAMIIDADAKGAKRDLDGALATMTAEYMKAVDLEAPAGRAYPGLNVLLGVLLLGGPWKTSVAKAKGIRAAMSRAFEELLANVQHEIRTAPKREIRDEIYRPEAALVEALAKGTLVDRLSAIRDMYRALRDRGSIRERHSVADQLNFVRCILELRGKEAIGPDRTGPTKITARSLLPLVDELLRAILP